MLHGSLVQDNGASVWTHSPQQHCLHITVNCLKKIKSTATNGFKLFRSGNASAKLGYALGAVFGFLVLNTSHVLSAGFDISGLGLCHHFKDQKSLWHITRAAYASLLPQLQTTRTWCWCLRWCSSVMGRAERGSGWQLWEGDQPAARWVSCCCSLVSPQVLVQRRDRWPVAGKHGSEQPVFLLWEVIASCISVLQSVLRV